MATYKLAGSTFATDRNPKLKQLRPAGSVSFEKETDPKVLEIDEGAVRILYKGDHIGYVPKSPIAQEAALAAGVGKIVDYCYWDSDLKFNDRHIGQWQGLTYSLEEVQLDNGRIIGGKYLRVTQFISFMNFYLSSDGLIKWAYDQGSTYDQYREALEKCSTDGTRMHSDIEKYFNGEMIIRGLGSPEEVTRLPQGWDNFTDKFKPEVEWQETRYYDNELMVTGMPDFAGTIEHNGVRKRVIIDWKSSKRPSKKHEVQASLYAHCNKVDNQDVEGALVVAFGSDNKQGYATKWISREQIESNYEACRHIKKSMDCVGVYIPEDQYYQAKVGE